MGLVPMISRWSFWRTGTTHVFGAWNFREENPGSLVSMIKRVGCGAEWDTARRLCFQIMAGVAPRRIRAGKEPGLESPGYRQGSLRDGGSVRETGGQDEEMRQLGWRPMAHSDTVAAGAVFLSAPEPMMTPDE